MERGNTALTEDQMYEFANPKLIIITGPSCSGKTTARYSLQKLDFGHYYPQFTTRKQRANEEEGVDYFFRTKREVKELEREGKLFIKTLFVNNEYYQYIENRK